MVAILGPFSADFQTHFRLIWQRNKQKGMKNDVRNGRMTVMHSEITGSTPEEETRCILLETR